jgi:stearoyl-CoA desaturase (delta-9 desaturase)
MYSARQGFYWWEIDISYYLLKFLSMFGIVWGLREVPKVVYDESRNARFSYRRAKP